MTNPTGRSRHATTERAALAAALVAAGPDAPTLCAGWTTRDLAIHVIMRERHLLASVELMVPPLTKRGEAVRQKLATTHYPTLVDTILRIPRWSPLRIGRIDEATNVVEYFVHTEDVRRAGSGWTPRPVSPDFEQALWRRVPALARMRFARFPAVIHGARIDRDTQSVLVLSPGYGEIRIGRGQRTATVTGAPGELLLFLFGRTSATNVTVEGPPDLVDRLRG
jgi:uncharacterized protein (TIGR03085 family)